MVTISNYDYEEAKKLLSRLASYKGRVLRETEGARRAYLLLKKWKRIEEKNRKNEHE